MRAPARLTAGEWRDGFLFSLGIFVVTGTMAALWQNPFFMRMTPQVGFERSLLVIDSLFAGFFFGIRTSACLRKASTTGGILGFLGVACPICNKLLVLLFGTGLLLQYFEPLRLYVGVAGTLVLGLTLYAKLQRRLRTQTRTNEPVHLP